MRWLAILFLLLCPALAQAGAWPREKGSVFFSASTTVRGDFDTLTSQGFTRGTYSAFYFEYGMTQKITVGIDAGYGSTGDYTVLAFARHPVGAGQGGHVFAIKAGAGTTRMGGVSQMIYMAGVDWGHGFQTGFGDGWLSLESGLHYFADQGEGAAKADLTLGLKPAKRTKLMLQLQAGRYPGSDAYLRLAPSVAWAVREGLQIEVGTEAGVINDTTLGLKFGTWLEF